MNIKLCLCVDSKDLFTSLSTQRNWIDRSIRGDVGCIRFEFQTGTVEKTSWKPGRVNLDDSLTEKDSVLTETLPLCLFTGRLSFNIDGVAETKSAGSNFG